MMTDLWRQAWGNRLRSLPTPVPLQVIPYKNLDGEMLSCMICNRGESGSPPEWLVTLSASDMTVVKGLHEACRVKQAGKVTRLSDQGCGASGGQQCALAPHDECVVCRERRAVEHLARI
jgi:hypothetical protein